MNIGLGLLVAVSIFIDYTCAYTCMSDDGKLVDWYIGYKFHMTGSYAYILPTSTKWTMSKFDVNSTGGMLYNTLEQIYKNKKDSNTLNVLYNNERPTSKETNFRHANKLFDYLYEKDVLTFSSESSSQKGHMKGALSFKRNSTGFWLIHSTPKFSAVNQYEFPQNAIRYGQTFFCTTYNYSSLGKIADQLLVGRPSVYLAQIPASISGDYAQVARLSNPPKSSIDSKVQSLVTKGGVEVTHFSKSADFGRDLYDALIAPGLKQNISVECWKKGRSKNLDSNCSSEYKVENIEEIDFKVQDIDFKSTQDHAKWAVGTSIICISDINRQVSQFKRGGGGLCMNNPAVAKLFIDIVKKSETCK